MTRAHLPFIAAAACGALAFPAVPYFLRFVVYAAHLVKGGGA